MMSRVSTITLVCLLAGSMTLGGCASSTPTAKERARATTHYDIAIATFNQGDLRGSLAELLKAVKLNPDLPVAHNAMGLVYHSLGHLDLGYEHYQKAVVLKPDFSEAYNNMGTLLIDLGRYDAAIEAFELALGNILYKTPALAEGNMGWAYYKKRDVERGLKHIRNAVATNPKFCRGYEWLARIALDENRDEEVTRSYRRFEKYCLDDVVLATQIAPEYRNEMKYYLALSLLRTGERQRARDVLAQCAVFDTEVGFGAKCATSLRDLE